MRGKAEKGWLILRGGRITPAYAGKSFTYAETLPIAKDHPRLCGEKFRSFSFLFVCAGSPPPMRGKVKF